jgi:catechol 2,3-dioxygenase-like lactoylglutathione lyase family enzyme
MSNSFRATRDVIIRTEDFKEAAQFYESVLGLQVFYNKESMLGFEAGGFRLYLEQGPQHGPVFDFLVADLEAAKLALLSAGCSVLEEDPAVPRCYIRDPHGLVFNIEQTGTAQKSSEV